MNYKERYNQALERAKKVHDGELTISPNEVNDFNVYEYIFPELRESEDERIRKELIDIVKKSPITFAFEDKGKVLAWLEKQGEQKLVKSEQNYYHNDGLYYAVDILEKTFGKVEGYQSNDGKMEHQIAIETVNALYHKKPADWSEEDDEYFMIQDVISGLQIAEDRLSKEGCTHLLESIKKSELWLKSLKPQQNQYDKGYNDGYSAAKYNHWKPSEEQMEALNFVIENVAIDNPIWNTNTEKLKSLYSDLLKL